MKWQRTRPTRPAQEGFTLVELLVAVTLLAIGIISVGQIFAVSARNASFGRTETTAVCLAREIQEKILSESVDQVKTMFNGVDTDNPGTVTVPCTVWAAHLASQLGPNGRGQIWVKDSTQDTELLPGMFSVEIHVSWVREGQTMTVPLHFAITEIGNQ